MLLSQALQLLLQFGIGRGGFDISLAQRFFVYAALAIVPHLLILLLVTVSVFHRKRR
jgi:hypothetical protein